MSPTKPPRQSLPRWRGMKVPTGPPALPGAVALPLDRIDPNPAQSRQVFPAPEMAELTESIRQEGILQPILVRPVGDRYQVVAGERRTRAARLAGLTEIPALIREMDDAAAALATAVENLQRQNLDLEDEARCFAHLQELSGLSDRALAERLGKARDYVNRRLRLLRDRPDLFAAIREGRITQRAALDLAAGGAGELAVSHCATLTTGGSENESASHGATLTTDGSDAADMPYQATLAERAALDLADGPAAAASLIPYRARAVQGAAATLTRTDWQSVPAKERAQVRLELASLRAALEIAEAALGGEA